MLNKAHYPLNRYRCREQIAQGATEQAKKLEISEVVNQLVISNGNVEESTNATTSAAENMKQSAKESQRCDYQDKMEIIKTTVDQSNQIMGELDVKLRGNQRYYRNHREIVDQTNLLALNASIEAAKPVNTDEVLLLLPMR